MKRAVGWIDRTLRSWRRGAFVRALALAASAMLSLAASPASAGTQPAGTPGRALTPASADEMVKRLLAAARRGTVGERVAFSLNSETANAEPQATMTVRIFAGTGPAFADRALRLDLPTMSVCVSQERAVFTRASEPGTYFELAIEEHAPAKVIEPRTIEALFPPLAVPQIALAFGDDAFVRPTAFGGVGVWALKAVSAWPNLTPLTTSAKNVERAGAVVLEGSGEHARTTLMIDVLNDRISEFVIAPATGRGGSVVRGVCVAFDAGPASSWMIPTAGRHRVESIDQLRKTATEVRVGERLPELAFQDVQQVAWSPATATPSGRGRGFGLLLLFRCAKSVDDASDRAIAADVVAGVRAGLDVCHRSTLKAAAWNEGEGVQPRRPIFLRGVGVFELGSFTRQRLDRLATAWQGQVTPLLPGDGAPSQAASLLWAATGTGSIDRVAPDATAMLVAVSEDQIVLALIRLDGRGEGRAAIGAELENALK